MYDFKIGNVYNFNTLVPTLLGTEFKNVSVLGLIDYTTACSIINVDLMHRKIYPLLPPGTVDNPKKYTYLLVMTESGNKTVVAYPWIDASTIVLVDSVTITVTLANRNSTDAAAIRDAITLLGFKDFTIEVK